MAPRKLSDADKQAIAALYRQPEETTTTLAARYGVSNSTISRVLKQYVAEPEYSQLVQQKRGGGSSAPSDSTPVEADPPVPQVAEVAADPDTDPTEADRPAPPKRREMPRLRRSPATQAEEDTEADAAPASSEDLGEPEEDHPAIAVGWDEDDDLDEENDDYDEDDDLDEDDDDWDEGDRANTPIVRRQEQVEILPFTTGLLQKPCYLVVDRLSELVTCPLRDFSELGQIPEEEEQARTLPIFDNHRVARRFSRRNQRIITVPDGAMLEKTRPYLESKGITRLLIDGQVYALNH